jgi:RecB family exonuclease
MHMSPSAFSKLRSCEYLWFANSVLRIESRSRSRIYLDRGNLFHALLERAFRIYVSSGVPFAYEGDDGFVIARSVFTEQFESRGIQCTEPDALELLAAARWQLPRLRMQEWEIVHVDGHPLIERKL